MRISFWDRVLVVLYSVIGIVLACCIAASAFGYDVLGMFIERLNMASHLGKYIALGIAILIVLTGLVVIVIACRAGREGREKRSFVVVDSSDKGRVRIAMSAIEQMVRQAVGPAEGAEDIKINVQNEDDAVSICVDMSVSAGVHVPTVTLNMQRAIREFVEANCGIAVRGVSVTIHAVNGESPVAPMQWNAEPKSEIERVDYAPVSENSDAPAAYEPQEEAPTDTAEIPEPAEDLPAEPDDGGKEAGEEEAPEEMRD